MTRLLAILLMIPFTGLAQVVKPVQVYSTSGLLQWPSNFFATNFVAGANITLTPTTTGLLFSATSGSGDASGTNARQFGTLTLTNLSGLLSYAFTNYLAGGTNISVRVAGGTNFVDFAGAASGGSGLVTNDSQFGPSTTLTLKSGIQVTNVEAYGYLQLTNDTAPGLPPTNTVRLGVDNYAGRKMPEYWDDVGASVAFQPFFGNNRIMMLSPESGTRIGIYGTASRTNAGNTVSHTTPNDQTPYMVQVSTAATSNANASAFSSVYGAHSGTRGQAYSGYFYACEWMTTNSTASVEGGGGSPRYFVGLTALAAESFTNLVVTTNATGQYLGMYASSRESTNIYISARDAVAEFRTNTGMAMITSNLYRFYLYNAPTSKFAGWKLQNITSGGTAQGWFSNNVPTNFMAFGVAVKNSTSQVHSIRFSKQYLESPLYP